MAQDDHGQFNVGIENGDIDDFLPKQPRLSEPAKRKFRPWHKPRKQYIRRKQWCHEIERLIETISFPPDNRVLRYLSLPSEDMLDVHTLLSALDKDMRLKYVGFFYAKEGSPDDQRMNLSEAAMKAHERIEPSSHVARDMLEDAGNLKSPAYKTLRSHAPYHVVNIDLCDHFAAPRRANVYACIDALRSIAEIQHEKAGGNSWLFFLTTRIQPDYFDVLHLRAFISAIQSNVDASEDFKVALGKAFMQESRDLLLKLTDLADVIENADPGKKQQPGSNNGSLKALRAEEPNVIDGDTFRKFFCVGFGKWLLSFLAASNPQTKLEMLPSYYYAIGDEDRDMLSLAFKCTPQIQPLHDRYQLVKPRPEQPKQPVSEPRQGMQIVKVTSCLRNLDVLLTENPEQMESMISESMRFLSMADYDTSAYLEFVSGQDQPIAA